MAKRGEIENLVPDELVTFGKSKFISYIIC